MKFKKIDFKKSGNNKQKKLVLPKTTTQDMLALGMFAVGATVGLQALKNLND